MTHHTYGITHNATQQPPLAKVRGDFLIKENPRHQKGTGGGGANNLTSRDLPQKLPDHLSG
jgi:hypothetical protein